jgi:hypothetical protein
MIKMNYNNKIIITINLQMPEILEANKNQILKDLDNNLKNLIRILINYQVEN